MDRKLIWVGVGILGVVILATVLTVVFARPPGFNATTYEPRPAEEIILTKADGSEFRLSDYRGRVVLLFFGYTHCPDICPTTMANLKLAVEGLGADAGKVQVVFISVDPGRDTPEAAQQYVAAFHPSFIGLSGTEEELAVVWNDYGSFRELGPVDANGNYPVTHSARVTAVDQAGNLRLSFLYDVPWQEVLQDLQLLLDEG